MLILRAKCDGTYDTITPGAEMKALAMMLNVKSVSIMIADKHGWSEEKLKIKTANQACQILTSMIGEVNDGHEEGCIAIASNPFTGATMFMVRPAFDPATIIRRHASSRHVCDYKYCIRGWFPSGKSPVARAKPEPKRTAKQIMQEIDWLCLELASLEE